MDNNLLHSTILALSAAKSCAHTSCLKKTKKTKQITYTTEDVELMVRNELEANNKEKETIFC